MDAQSSPFSTDVVHALQALLDKVPDYKMLLRQLGAFLAVFHLSAVAVPECSIRNLQRHVPADAQVLYAKALPNGSSYIDLSDASSPLNATNLPACCVARLNVNSSPSSSFTLGILLPNAWNERFLKVGNGGFVGGINWGDMGSGAKYGFAVVSTNTGHNSSATDGSWALNAPEKRNDWGYRAIHRSATIGKSIAKGYYGKRIRYSYYSGCSTGGRQGLKELQLHPDTFDGVLAGAPAWWTTHLQPWFIYITAVNLPPTSPGHIPPDLFQVIGAEVLKQCDMVDGVEDSIIMDPSACDFHPTALLCNNTGSSACLTSPQLDTLYRIQHDWVETKHSFLFPHPNLGSELQWGSLTSGNEPSGLGTDYVRYFLLNDPTWDWHDLDLAVVQLADRENPGNANADDFDLYPFHTRGGKLLHYHGLADGVIPTGSSELFYDHVYRTLAPRGVGLPPWYRFFLVPGMGHCAGSFYDAPWYFAGPIQAAILGVRSVPGFEDAEHDALLALMKWVEEDKAPDAIIATKFRNDSVALGVERRRPFCPYPNVARFVRGNVNESSSWTC